MSFRHLWTAVEFQYSSFWGWTDALPSAFPLCHIMYFCLLANLVVFCLSCFSQGLSRTGEPAAGPSITQVISEVLNRGIRPAVFVLINPGQSTRLVLLQGSTANSRLTHCPPGSPGTQVFLHKVLSRQRAPVCALTSAYSIPGAWLWTHLGWRLK